MAEFGARATELSAPQGAGASPVMSQSTGSALAPVADLANLFVKGIGSMMQNQQAAFKQTILNEHSQKLQAINDAVARGDSGKDAAWAATQIRRVNNMYGGQYPQFIEDLKKTNSFFMEGTESGVAIAEVNAADALRRKQLSDAASSGYSVFKGMSKEAEDSAIFAYQAEIRAKEQMERAIKANAEFRASANFSQEQSDRFIKDTAKKTLMDVADAGFTAFRSFSQSLGEQVRSGKITPDAARAKLDERYDNISRTLIGVGGLNKDLVAPYTDLFGKLYATGQKLIDPNVAAEDSGASIKILDNQAALLARADPRNHAAIMAGQLFPNMPIANYHVSLRISDILAAMSQGKSTHPDGSPVAILGTESEPVVVKQLQDAIKQLNGGVYKDKTEQARIEAGNSVDVLLREAGSVMSRDGATPKSLSGLSAFIASPEYLSLAKSGKISPEAAQVAKKTFQLNFEPAIQQGVNAKMKDFLYGQAVFKRGGKQAEPWELGKFVNISFVGDQLKFTIKDDAGLDPVEKQSLREATASLRSTEATVTQVIKQAAHLEQRSDYGKFFDEVKHVWFPGQFSKYKDLKIGDIVDGHRYVGGDANIPSSWRNVNGSTTK